MHTDKPLAAPGLVSYRCRGPYGWIMIGAKDDADAMREAQRSNQNCTRDGLEIWSGERYVPVEVRDYYVTMIRAKRTAFLAGPLATHAQALALVDAAKRKASEVDPWSDFDAFGTSSLPVSNGNPFGKLNQHLGVVPRPPLVAISR